MTIQPRQPYDLWVEAGRPMPETPEYQRYIDLMVKAGNIVRPVVGAYGPVEASVTPPSPALGEPTLAALQRAHDAGRAAGRDEARAEIAAATLRRVARAATPFAGECMACEGTGHEKQQVCARCEGSGRTEGTP